MEISPMNDIHTRSAEIAVRPRVSHVDAREGPPAQPDSTAGSASAATVTGNGRPVPSAKEPPDARDQGRRSVEQAVARLNDYVQSLQRDIQFSVDAESRQPVVRVVERGSQELIRQIPSETALRLARSLIELSELSELQANDIALFRAEA
jgi:flagellar protein FlaG